MIAALVVIAGAVLLFISQFNKRPVLTDFGPPPPRRKGVNDPPLPAPPPPAKRAPASGAILPPPLFPKRSTMPVPRDVTEVRPPAPDHVADVREGLKRARAHLDQAERELNHGKPALALEDVTLAEAALVDLHWPLMRLAGAKP